MVFILVFLTSPVSLSYLGFHLLTFPSYSPVLYWPYFSQLHNQLLSFSFSLSLSPLLYPCLFQFGSVC